MPTPNSLTLVIWHPWRRHPPVVAELLGRISVNKRVWFVESLAVDIFKSLAHHSLIGHNIEEKREERALSTESSVSKIGVKVMPVPVFGSKKLSIVISRR